MKKNNDFTPNNANHHSKTRPKREYTSIDSVACFGADPPLLIIPFKYSLKPPPTVWLTLLVTSLFGILAVTLHSKTNLALATVVMTSPDEEATKEEVVKVINKNFSNNIGFIAAQCEKMVSIDKSFAIFEHGTGVLINSPLDEPATVAKSSLKLVFEPDIGFDVKALDNNNYLVTFEGSLFYWFSAKLLARNKEAMLMDPRLARKDKDSKKIKLLTDFEIRIGKLARLNMKADRDELAIAKIMKT